jgi:flagellar motor switch protein FliM
VADAERILSQNEVDALLSAIDSGAQVASPDDAAVAYDFRHPARLAREQMRALQILHEGFARALQTGLSGLLRGPSEVKVAGVHALSMKEALHTLPSPTVLALLSCEPLDGYFLLEMNPAIAGPLIERMLGSGKAATPGDPRPLTALEWGVYDTLLSRMLDLLREAWAPVASATFRAVRRESDPGVLQLPHMEEMAVMVVLEIVAGEQRGSMDLIFPVHAVEGSLSKLLGAPTVPMPKKPATAGAESGLPKRISPAEVAVSAHLPGETVRMQEIRELKPGDLLVSSHASAAPVLVSVEGCPKFHARLGRLKDHRAVKIGGPAPRDAAGAGVPPRASVISSPGPASPGSIPAVEALLSVPLLAVAVLAEKRTSLKDVLALRPGDLLEFQRRVDAPLELRVGDRRLADGAAVRVGEQFGLRITAIADPRDRVRALGT